MRYDKSHPVFMVLILAWLLAVFGADFWHFNVMELFASVAIIVGVIWTYTRWRSERNRKLKLIDFPNIWRAYKRKENGILETEIIADVFFPHHALSYKASAEIEGRIIPMQFAKPHSASFVGGRWIMEGKAPLSIIPQAAKTIDLSVEIQLDGGIKKSSGKRTVAIIDS